MELIVLSFAAATALLLVQFAADIRNWLASQFTQE
jgi:hypothetical protein